MKTVAFELRAARGFRWVVRSELGGRTPLSSFLLKEDGVAAYQTMFLVPDETQTYDGVGALELDAVGRPLN